MHQQPLHQPPLLQHVYVYSHLSLSRGSGVKGLLGGVTFQFFLESLVMYNARVYLINQPNYVGVQGSQRADVWRNIYFGQEFHQLRIFSVFSNFIFVFKIKGGGLLVGYLDHAGTVESTFGRSVVPFVWRQCSCFNSIYLSTVNNLHNVYLMRRQCIVKIIVADGKRCECVSHFEFKVQDVVENCCGL